MRYSATYVREGDQILAFHEDHLIAHGTNFSKVEETAVEYLDNLQKSEDKDKESKKVKAAKYVETPNGLKGEILGNVEGLWGEREITVRWANGRIAKYDTHGKGFEYVADGPKESQSALAYLESTLDADYDRDKESLVSRVKDLDEIVVKVATVIGTGVSSADERKLDKLALQAEAEKSEINEALEYLDRSDIESFTPPVSTYSAAEQVELKRPRMSRGDNSSWLDETVDDMIREAEDQDFDKLLDEGPGQFVIDLDTGALSSQGTTHELALAHIISKTAGLVGEDIDNFRKAFCVKAEEARRVELKDRTKKVEKQAKKQSKEDKTAKKVSDDALFL